MVLFIWQVYISDLHDEINNSEYQDAFISKYDTDGDESGQNF